MARTSHRTKLNEYLTDELADVAGVHGMLSHARLDLTAPA